MFGTDHITRSRGRLVCIILAAGAAALAVGSVVSLRPDATNPGRRAGTAISTRTIHYRSHNGVLRAATVILPTWYGPADNPPIPLVISPHGRNGSGQRNAEYWGTLPGVGGFAVVNPDGMGRRLSYNSYGYVQQIDDLARMPDLVTAALPWLRIDRRRVFALGSSMGGQETLLLVARHPEVLAGAVAMDSVTDLARRYRQMPELGQPGLALQKKLTREVGATPAGNPRLYAERSPLTLAAQIAASGVPLQIWWSRNDRIVIDQAHQSGSLFRSLHRLDPCCPVTAFVGRWAHSHEMRSTELLPIALVKLGLLQDTSQTLPESVAYSGPAAGSTA